MLGSTSRLRENNFVTISIVEVSVVSFRIVIRIGCSRKIERCFASTRANVVGFLPADVILVAALILATVARQARLERVFDNPCASSCRTQYGIHCALGTHVISCLKLSLISSWHAPSADLSNPFVLPPVLVPSNNR